MMRILALVGSLFPLSFRAKAFVSPYFTETDLMRRVSPAPVFAARLDKFLPRVRAAPLAPVLPPGDACKAFFRKAASAQAEAGWRKLFTTNYGGTTGSPPSRSFTTVRLASR
jgi:hypothetical protein